MSDNIASSEDLANAMNETAEDVTSASSFRDVDRNLPLLQNNLPDPLSSPGAILHSQVTGERAPIDDTSPVTINTPLPSDAYEEDDNSSDASSTNDTFFDADTGSSPPTPKLETTDRSMSPAPSLSDLVNTVDGSDDIATQKSVDVDTVDVVDMVDGMYRILDLVSERGSSGFVDKIVICQEAFGRFVNDVLPGAYTSLIKVDFTNLDNAAIKPLGLYGSQTEIVRFLQDVGVLSPHVASRWLVANSEEDSGVDSGLRSGIYVIRAPVADIFYVVYWPEATTWNDNANDSIARNRITFMRYLTKISDQRVALISREHADSLVWQQPSEGGVGDFDEDYDRICTFNVCKTEEQEENAVSRTGFTIHSSDLASSVYPGSNPIDPDLLEPRLVHGDMVSGYMTVRYKAKRIKQEAVDWHSTSLAFRDYIRNDCSFRFGCLSEDAFTILTNHGLGEYFPGLLEGMISMRNTLKKELHTRKVEAEQQYEQYLADRHEKLVYALRCDLSRKYSSFYKSLMWTSDLDTRPSGINEDWSASEFLRGVKASCPSTSYTLDQKISYPHNFISQKFKSLRSSVSSSLDLWAQDSPTASRLSIAGIFSWGVNTLTSLRTKGPEVSPKGTPKSLTMTTDLQFLDSLPALVRTFPNLHTTSQQIKRVAEEYLATEITNRSRDMAQCIDEACRKEQTVELAADLEQQRLENLWTTRESTIQKLNSMLACRGQGRLEISDIESRSRKLDLHIRGMKEIMRLASLEYTVHAFQLTQEDRHAMWHDEAHLPTPKTHTSTNFAFEIEESLKLVHIQLLQDDRCLLMIQVESGDVEVFVERYPEVNTAVRLRRSKKCLKQDRLGANFLVSFNEAKRVMVVCAMDEMKLHHLQFDELYTTLYGVGSIEALSVWYSDETTALKHIVLCGGQSEELLIIDSRARARIYSFAAQQMRPSSVQLQGVPLSVHSSPDGSCFLCVSKGEQGSHLQVYHWSSFGSTNGISLQTIPLLLHSCILTSFAKRNIVYFLWLNPSAPEIQSLALTITHKVTAFTFNEDEENRRRLSHKTLHNSLLDCHEEIWTKFPVVPAVQRQILASSIDRCPCSTTYVSHLQSQLFHDHHIGLIATFEKTTRKPTGTQLSSVHVTGTSYEAFLRDWNRGISVFRLGEWLVNILCLIPIHLAVAQDNRFMPLKDGVFSSDLEQSLLGATVDQIVDNLSFGWYESIFSSYSARKPVRVVSSMGEQSVGKSFMLNHFADTSFAGSAMRTTEGIWMSVTPTDEALLVSLDFEGVHSIERSAQEDTLLVLFNVAISNLVLFRNNFALSRDITHLFQSFQSSSIVLDPGANPLLFQSALVVIIKDVIDSDKAQIVKEFQLKFQRIVEVEQGANFITRLHDGKLNIVPWPVIESRQFYDLFPRLKGMLDKQPITHPRAGVFLQKLKTLMAKLKANDWGSLDQNLVSYRVQRLSDILPTALKYGATEMEPDLEPLRDFDNGEVIDLQGSRAVFNLDHTAVSSEQEAALSILQKSWPGYSERHEIAETDWFDGLRSYLQHLGDERIDLVKRWMTINTARFTADSTFFDLLHREFETGVVALQSNIKVCRLQCADCHLLCLRIQQHEGQHTCYTTHQCLKNCRYEDEHDRPVLCGLPAGHTGVHFCDISAHLCGAPCDLMGKKGCLQRCSKSVNHSEAGHTCPALAHGCGMPCSLTSALLPDGSMYHCQEVCQIPINELHTTHTCQSQSCPIRCCLCKRLCAVPNHMHGLDSLALHLCGEEHACPGQCQSKGVCRIETAPQSVEATFTGRHETFQYTKYSQVAKRLPCGVVIPKGEIEHEGPHIHTTEKPFHACETRCKNCGYYCMLPLGHSQKVHETSHGSMSSTRWQIIGHSMEVGDRQFASNDDGAPMMCSMVCRAIGRHVHIAACQSEDARACSGSELQHISESESGEDGSSVDAISHSLYWRRTGFKDPYSQDEQADFARCDWMCSGPEHHGDASNPAVSPPSYCNLPLFHAPLSNDQPPPGGIGYISSDGHHYGCNDPAQMQRHYHIIFVVDRSSSMAESDNRPLQDSPTTTRIAAANNNRLGAVYSSLSSFWTARHDANRSDTYTVILFESRAHTVLRNDQTSSPDELLGMVLQERPRGGTSFDRALEVAETELETHWSDNRQPIVIFLSDGECHFQEQVMRSICRKALALGTALSFHSVSFGSYNVTLQSMTSIATTIQNSVAEDPAQATVPSSYTQAITTIQLAETFLGISNSLRKTRGSLVY